MLTLIEDAAGLEALRPEWSDLWRRCPDATPFQSPEWLLAWLRHLYDGGRIRSIAVRDESGRLVGLLPLYLWGERFQHLTLLGTGITDYNDVLLDGAALPELRGIGEDANFEELRDGSPLLQLGPKEACSVSPVVELPATPEPKLATDIRRSGNRLRNSGLLEMERYTDLSDLFVLHRGRWRERGQEGMLAGERMEAFHREVASGFEALGILRLYRLMLDSKTVAVVYAFTHRGRCYGYLSGFEPALAKLSPGTVLLAHVMEEAEREGVKEFDFLRGEEEYKLRWGAKNKTAWRVRL